MTNDLHFFFFLPPPGRDMGLAGNLHIWLRVYKNFLQEKAVEATKQEKERKEEKATP
jgi:hypothetical protein